LFNVLERYCVHIMLKLLVIIEAQSVEFVERAMITESVVALIGDLLLPNQFLFRSRQFLRREAIVCELVNFIKQRGFYRLDLLWIGSEIKCKKSRDQALHLTCADVISPTWIANADEETRPEIATRFIDQFQGVAIRARHARPAKSHHDHALRLLFAAFNGFRLAQRRRRFCISQSKLARLHLAEHLF